MPKVNPLSILFLILTFVTITFPLSSSKTFAQTSSGKITFIRDGEIYLINPDGSGETKLTTNAKVEPWGLTWSPDGTKVAFLAGDVANTGLGDLTVVYRDTSERKLLGKNVLASSAPAWSPDGKKLAFASKQEGNEELYLVSIEGGKEVRLTTDPAADNNPAWSPDGRKIAFVSGRDYSDNNPWGEVYLMNADGSDQRKVSQKQEDHWYPLSLAWSPDGKQIAFGCATSGLGYTGIYIVNLDDTKQSMVGGGDNPVWSPDGTKVASSCKDGPFSYICILKTVIEGDKVEEVSTEQQGVSWSPTWSPDGTSLAFAFTPAEAEDVEEIHLIQAANAEGKKLTNGTSPFWLSSVAPPYPSPQPQDKRCFTETNLCIAGTIRAYWEQNGGLAVFGLPISEQREELIEGNPYQVQWFERSCLELHPENKAPYHVLLGRLGMKPVESAQKEGKWQPPSSEASKPNCLFFPEMGWNVCGEILKAYRASGLELDGQTGFRVTENKALFGLPLTPLVEMELGGQKYQVQWFERARFELHPENKPPNTVLLGLLGNEVLAGINPSPSLTLVP